MSTKAENQAVIDAAVAEMTATDDAEESANKLIDVLVQLAKDNTPDNTALIAAMDQAVAARTKLAASVVANTPAA